MIVFKMIHKVIEKALHTHIHTHFTRKYTDTHTYTHYTHTHIHTQIHINTHIHIQFHRFKLDPFKLDLIEQFISIFLTFFVHILIKKSFILINNFLNVSYISARNFLLSPFSQYVKKALKAL